MRKDESFLKALLKALAAAAVVTLGQVIAAEVKRR